MGIGCRRREDRRFSSWLDALFGRRKLNRQQWLPLAERMFQDVAAERVARPQGRGGHHRLRPIPQGHVPDRHGRALRQRSQCHENRLALHPRLRLCHSDVERAIDTHCRCRTGDKRSGEDGDGPRPVRPCRRSLFGQGSAHDVFFRRCRLEAASWSVRRDGDAFQPVPSTPLAGCVKPAAPRDCHLPEHRRLAVETGHRRLAGFCRLPVLTRNRVAAQRTRPKEVTRGQNFLTGGICSGDTDKLKTCRHEERGTRTS